VRSEGCHLLMCLDYDHLVLYQDTLDLIQADGVAGAIIQLGRARRLVIRTACGAICCACSIVPPFCR
jgi:hypothetical protein